RLIANGLCYLSKRRAGMAQSFGGYLHPPVGEIMHWRHSDEAEEVVCQGGPRQSSFATEIVHSPVARDITVQQRQCLRDVRFGQACEPARLVFRQAFGVTPDGLNEQ